MGLGLVEVSGGGGLSALGGVGCGVAAGVGAEFDGEAIGALTVDEGASCSSGGKS